MMEEAAEVFFLAFVAVIILDWCAQLVLEEPLDPQFLAMRARIRNSNERQASTKIAGSVFLPAASVCTREALLPEAAERKKLMLICFLR
jgi:hypothetical protein